MPDYGDILRFLAENPPGLEAERNLHASLLELLATCLRTDGEVAENLVREARFSFDQGPQRQATSSR